jgi:hypothetical protein
MSHMSRSRAYEKAALTQMLIALVEAGQPEVMLACLKRVVEHKAFGVTTGLIGVEEADRWLALANALRAAEETLKKAA